MAIRQKFITMFGGRYGPKSIPGLSFWHDAASAGSITLNGSDVAAQSDLSGRGVDASQGTAAAQPGYSTGSDGKALINYVSANSDSLVLSNAASIIQNVPGFTFISVMRASSFGGARRVFTAFGGTNLTRFVAGLLVTTGKMTLSTRRLDADSTVTASASSAGPAANVFSVVAWRCNYATGEATFFVDGQAPEIVSVSWAGGNGNTSDTANSLTTNLGAQGGATLNGDWREDCAYSRAISDAEYNALRTRYLKPKWATP